MIFIKKILEKDKKQSMLIGLALICLFFIIKICSNNHKIFLEQEELRLPRVQNTTPMIKDYPGWNSIAAQAGDHLSLLFNRAGLSQKILHHILAGNPYHQQLHHLKTEQIYYFKIIGEELQELIFYVDQTHFLRITKIAQQHYQTKLLQGDINEFLSLSNTPAPKAQPSTISSDWQSVAIQPGDTLGRIFKRAGLPYQTMLAILHDNPQQKNLVKLNPHMTIHFHIQNHQLKEMIFPIHEKKYLLIRPKDAGYQTLVRLGKPELKPSAVKLVKPLEPIQPKPTMPQASTSITAHQNTWLSIRPQRGDTLGRIFNRAGLGQKEMQTILYKNPYARQLNRINLNDEIRFKIQNHQLIEMVYNLDALRYLSITKHGTIYQTKVENRPKVEKVAYISTPVTASLYQTARVAGIPTKLIEQMNQIFYWQVQLSREIRPGDRLNMAYQTYYVDGKKVATGDILAVSYKHANGIKYEAIRHQSRNGQVHYYRPNGSSLKKAFSRYPIRFSHISSNFGSSRKHPILKYRRPHKGIDLAAPIGTPIYAIGDGRIHFIGRQNGYGNMIKIDHAFSYTTVYAHMLRFQKGLRAGSHVQKGQIIGFVGQSGLATGPHCHYEIHVNHIPRNPTSVALPQALPITRQESYAFNRFTREILAQINLYEATKLASRR